MSFDEFFTDGDKPYAENLNDSLALIDAFDVTVPAEMPTMFSNGEFNSTVNVTRKCGVALVTLRSVDSGVTVGTDSITGTGSVVFRVYPNFNSFYKWSKIILEKTGTVSISFRKTDGTEISATVGSDGTISESSALKQLQEIDVVFTLTSANISNILIWFINNQSERTRTGALLEASQLANVDGQVVSGETKAVNGGAVYDAIDTVNTDLSADISSLSNVVSGKENAGNKVTTLDNSYSHYPSCIAVKNVTDTKSNVGHHHISSDITDLINVIYPVGSIYMSVNDVNPANLFGGTWEQIKDRFLLAKGDTYATNGATGGEATHTLTVEEIPSHTHTQNAHSHGTGNSTNKYFITSSVDTVYITDSQKSQTNGSNGYNIYTSTHGSLGKYTATQSVTATNQNEGGGQAHNNMPPYIVVNVWKRTA